MVITRSTAQTNITISYYYCQGTFEFKVLKTTRSRYVTITGIPPMRRMTMCFWFKLPIATAVPENWPIIVAPISLEHEDDVYFTFKYAYRPTHERPNLRPIPYELTGSIYSDSISLGTDRT